MAASERLSVDDARAPTVLAAQHLHRYELAGELCSGLRVLDVGCGVGYGSDILARAGAASVEGVDVDEAAVAAAAESFGSDTVRFTRADALERLRSLEPGEVDVIVSFEALEHLGDATAALDAVRELAAGGVKLILSVPNSRTFEEENEFHVTDFGYDEAIEAFGAIEGATLLYQHIAEGSLIAPAGGASLTGVVRGLEDADPEYANTFLAVAGFPEESLDRATARLAVVARPNLNRYMLGLQTANDELWRTNQRLLRQAFARSDAAAAAAIGRLERRIAELELLETQHEDRIEELTIVAARNDQLYQQQLAWRDARRYHAVDWLHDRVLALTGLKRARRLLRRGG
jgi:2-polyprenyl-3-methyl-5-hydroxy-6-metoxy-1,4-benzoquinol methylase